MDEDFRTRHLELTTTIGNWLPEDFPWESSNILDFGCGEGLTALGFAQRKRCTSVVGIDIMPDVLRCLQQAKENISIAALPDNLALHQVSPGELHSNAAMFDLIYSWSVFEHVDQILLSDTMRLLVTHLVPGGYMFIQIAPLYYSAEGSHLNHKVSEPWAHLTLQGSHLHDQLRISCGTSQEFDALWSMYSTLNRLTTRGLRQLVTSVNLTILREHVTQCRATPPTELLQIYHHDVLTTEQIVLLARKQV